MIININNFNIQNYNFALNYLQKYKHARWDNRYNQFQLELLQKMHDNKDFDINPDVFNWEHVMIAERYVDQNKTKYQNALERYSIMHSFYGEMGSNNPFNKFNKRNGGKTKRRVRRRARCMPSLKKGTTASRYHKM